MKTIKILSICLITCALSLSGWFLMAESGSSSETSSETSKWKQYARRKPDLYWSPIKFDGGIGWVPGSKVPMVGLNGSVSLEVLDCCQVFQDEHSWCNYGADDIRCPN